MTCPYLGSRADQTIHHDYPTENNVCYAERDRDITKLREIGAGHQQRYCLGTDHPRCPIYTAAQAKQEGVKEGNGAQSSAETLYEEGMAHYRRREWIEARECFRQLHELEPNRKAINDLLDDLNLFIQLQSMRAAGDDAGGPGGAIEDITDEAVAREISDETDHAPLPAQGESLSRGKKRSGWLVALVLTILVVAATAVAVFATDLSFLQKPQNQTQLTNLYNRGQSRLAVGDYAGAIATFQELLELAPDDREAQVGLERAKRLRTLAQLYAEAEQLIADENWGDAAEKLQAILELDPSYQDAHELSNTVERQRRLIALYEQGKTNYELGNWAAATADFEQLRSLDSEFRSDVVQEYLFQSYLNDGLALIDGAGEAVEPLKEAIQRFASALGIHPRDKRAIEERRLANLYLDGRIAYSKKLWNEAVTKMRDVYSARGEYAGGWAAKTLYSAYIQLGDEYLANDNCQIALDMYRLALTITVGDKSVALQREIEVQYCLASPTPTPTLTSTSTPTPTRTPTPRATSPATWTPVPPPTQPPTLPPPTLPPPTQQPPTKPPPPPATATPPR